MVLILNPKDNIDDVTRICSDGEKVILLSDISVVIKDGGGHKHDILKSPFKDIKK